MWSASASTAASGSGTWHHYHGTASAVANDSAGTSRVSCNGWWIEGQTVGTGQVWRIQYAWVPPVSSFQVQIIGQEEPLTVQYAPICEMGEVEPIPFREYMRRLEEDPDFREAQLEAQERLFIDQHECPLWLTDGLRLLHKLIEHGLNLDHIRQTIMEPAYGAILDHRIGDPTFMGIPAKFDEVRSLQELLEYDDQRILDIHQQYLHALQSYERFIEITAPLHAMAALSFEEQKAADEKALELLKNVLSPSEMEGLIKNGHVKIPSVQDPDVIYLVKRSPHERIDVYKGDKLKERLCVVFKEPLPSDDILLTKIFMAKYNERDMLEVANHFPIAVSS